MRPLLIPLLAFVNTAVSLPAAAAVADSSSPAVRAAMQRLIDAREISGAVTLVIGAKHTWHLDAVGFADASGARAMQSDTIFWIASMTKPFTGVAVLMLHDEGRLNVTDPVAKYLPEFAKLKTPSGQPANLTIAQILSHTSGMGDLLGNRDHAALTLEGLMPLYLARPMEFEPGTKWHYCQAGINTAGRIVEVISGQPFDVFLQERLLGPLGMKDTCFFPRPDQQSRLVGNTGKNSATGALEPRPLHFNPTKRDRPPLPNNGLFSTAADYGRFAQMLLQRGAFDGRVYLRPATFALMTSVHSGSLAAGFVPGSAWGLTVGLVREPQGVTAMLSPGSFGHGGREGTQAWIDPVKGFAYILMIQRDDIGDSDGSPVRLAFQTAATGPSGP